MICVAFVNIVMTVLYVHPMSIVELGWVYQYGVSLVRERRVGRAGCLAVKDKRAMLFIILGC